MSKHLLSAVVAGMALSVTGAQAADANWPTRTISFVVPSGAGGVTDLMARMYAQKLSEKFGQSIVVENKPGASGTIALQAALAAPADGYTFVVGYPSNLIAPRYQFNKLSFNADADFVPISSLVVNEMVVVGNPTIPGDTFKDYIANLQKRGQASAIYGSYGEGSYSHLVANYLNVEYKLQATHVPYKTEPQMTMAVTANEVPWGVNALASAKPLAEAGKIKILGVFAPERSIFAPKVPTLKEQGFDDPVLAFTGFSGLFAKKGTPEAVIRKMEAAIVEAGKDPAFREKFVSSGIPMTADGSAALERTYQQNVVSYKLLSEKAGIEKK